MQGFFMGTESRPGRADPAQRAGARLRRDHRRGWRAERQGAAGFGPGRDVEPWTTGIALGQTGHGGNFHAGGCHRLLCRPELSLAAVDQYQIW